MLETIVLLDFYLILFFEGGGLWHFLGFFD